MSDEQRKTQSLARWRAKRRLRRHRTVMDKLFGTGDADSEEKIAQRHTSRGRDLAADDRRYHIKGGGTGGLA